jgi:hypothetical protein
MELRGTVRDSGRMSEKDRSDLAGRLRLVDSLLSAVGDSLSSLQRLLSEVHNEIDLARREEEESSRDDEIQALRREVEQLREGMTSRAVIERAKGILMQTHSLSESESFDLLNEMSHRRHRKLRDVAVDVATGAQNSRVAPRPGNGSPPAGGTEESDGAAEQRPEPARAPKVPVPTELNGSRS